MHIDYRQWADGPAFKEGEFDGTSLEDDALRFDGSSRTVASWTSPELGPGFDASEIVASWNADTPGGTWLEVSVAVRTGGGDRSPAYTLARWAADDDTIQRTTIAGQSDAAVEVEHDTLTARMGSSFAAWRVTVTLCRNSGSSATPSVRLIGVMASTLPSRERLAQTSPPGTATGVVLDVPTYSQQVHRGRFPEYGGGGEAWCSPTSTAMVVAYWGGGPDPTDYSWVPPGYPDPWVIHAVRGTFDHAYRGTGNWPFNTAYAARFRCADGTPLAGYVTRLTALTEAEQLVAAGIPVIASVAFTPEELTGAGYHTDGHLLVIVGFTATGDVVVNDPASHLQPSNDAVRTTYDRTEFENAWIPTTGGIAYVIHPATLRPTAPHQDCLS